MNLKGKEDSEELFISESLTQKNKDTFQTGARAEKGQKSVLCVHAIRLRVRLSSQRPEEGAA